MTAVALMLAVVAAAQGTTNDNFEQAANLAAPGGNLTVNNTQAGRQLCDPLIPGVFADGRTVWYRHVSTAAGGRLSVSVANSPAPAALAIYRGTNHCGLTLVNATGTPQARSLCLEPSTTYYVMVDTIAGPGSIALNYSAASTLLAPQGLQGSQGFTDEGIDLTWIASQGAATYRLRRSTDGVIQNSVVVAESITATNYRDVNVSPGTTYFYWIQAVAECLESSSAGPATGWRACEFGLSPAARDVPASGGSQFFTTVDVDGPCPWFATVEAGATGWLSIAEGEAGLGPNAFRYVVLANTQPTPRTAKITVAGKTHTVNQAAAPCTIGLPLFPGNAPYQGGSYTVAMTTTAGCAWEASSLAPWITLTGATSGTGSANIAYSVAANNSTTSRSGAIKVGAELFTVNQAAAPPCSFQAPSILDFPCAGGERSLTITANRSGCCYNFQTAADWITVPSGNHCGTKTFTVTVPQNFGDTTRTGTISVAGRTVTVRVAACPVLCPITLDPAMATITNDGATSASLRVTTAADCAVEAEPLVDWISLGDIVVEEPGSFRVYYHAPANPGTDLQGAVRLFTSDAEALFPITLQGRRDDVRRALLAEPSTPPPATLDRNEDAALDAADLVE